MHFPSLTVTHVTFPYCKNVVIEDSCSHVTHLQEQILGDMIFNNMQMTLPPDYMAPIGTAAQGGSASICNFVQRSGITAVPFTSMSTWQTFYPALNVKQKDVIIVQGSQPQPRQPGAILAWFLLTLLFAETTRDDLIRSREEVWRNQRRKVVLPG